MSLSEFWSIGESLLASLNSPSGSGQDSLFVFLVCLLALLALGESIPHRNPCPGCWESDREGCRQMCGAYRSWERRSSRPEL